ncbi:MAG: glycosyltransferase [Acidimicrobiia bacterium]|nr:glycosyltransferase [Acidimicrobiia bacterium]
MMGETMRRRVADLYGVAAEILPPPISFEVDGPTTTVDGVEPGFFLAAARLMPYKNLDAVVAAFAELSNERLVIAGDGPEREALEAAATANIRFVGTVGDARLRWLYGNCRALVSAGFEAYPLTPIEAAGFSKPTLALREGGSVDVVVEGRTGEFFDRPVPQAIVGAVHRLHAGDYDAAELARLRERHAEHTFAVALRAIVDEELARTG